MSVSFERKMLNRNNLFVDDPHDKHLATSAQKKATDDRDRKKLRKFWKTDIKDQILDLGDET